MDSRLKYHVPSEAGPSAESTYYQRYTEDRGVDTAVNFVAEGQEDACIDPSQCFLKTTFRVLASDGSAPGESSTAFLKPSYGANLWSQVSVSLNNRPLAPGNDYVYTAFLIDLVGATPDARDESLTPLSGFASPHFGTSIVKRALGVNPETFEDHKNLTKMFSPMTTYYRIHSDFLMSCSQLLPNRMQLAITLTRGKDAFVLGKEPSDSSEYKIDIVSVSLFVRRVRLNPTALQTLNESLKEGGKLQYQRLHMIPIPCAKGTLTWSWHNCFHNVLPRRVFVALVAQQSYFGSYDRISTYLESVKVKTVRFCQDGREVMAEPYTCAWRYYEDGTVDWERSDARAAFAGFQQTLNTFASPRQLVGMRYMEFRNGSTVYATSLGHAATAAAAQGSLDVHIEFASAVTEPLNVLVMGENQDSPLASSAEPPPTEEVFRVTRHKTTSPIPLIYVEDLMGDKILGGLYPEEYQEVTWDGKREIDKVLKERKGYARKYLVSYKGWPAKFNEWIKILPH